MKNKALYNLEQQNIKFSALSSRNVGEHEFLTGTDVSPKKGLLEKAATTKRFEHSSLCGELN